MSQTLNLHYNDQNFGMLEMHFLVGETSDYDDSGSGSFSLESLESAPVLELAALVVHLY